MPSNDQLRASIAQAAEKLGIDAPDTSEQNNAQMAETLKELNAQIEAAEAEAERAALEEKAEEDAAAAAALAKVEAEEAKAAESKELPPYYVPEGKAITAKGGRILSDNAEITADDLAGGQKALDAFVKSGHVAKG